MLVSNTKRKTTTLSKCSARTFRGVAAPQKWGEKKYFAKVSCLIFFILCCIHFARCSECVLRERGDVFV